MLYFKDFAPLSQKTKSFTFDRLKLTTQTIHGSKYSDDYGNLYLVLKIIEVEEVLMIDELAQKGIIFNYKGVLVKDRFCYVFALLNQFQSLTEFIQRNNNEKELLDEKFCIQMIQILLLIFIELEKQYRRHFKFITPINIGLKNSKEKQKRGFGILLPFPHHSFTYLKRTEFQDNKYYTSPQIASYFSTNSKAQICEKQFKKASLYSLGLIILFCFGYKEVSLNKNGREFKIFFKNIRKEIKLLHKGKFVPKTLKLLLQNCEKSRDNLDTFSFKIHSTQFQSLKVEPFSPFQQIKMTTMLTRSDKSQPKLNRTIVIEGSRNSSIMVSDKSIEKSFQQFQSGKSQNIIPMQNSPINLDIPVDEQEEMEEMQEKKELDEIDEEKQIEYDEYMHDLKKIESQMKLEEDVIRYNIDEVRFSKQKEKNLPNGIMDNIQEEEIFPQPEELEEEVNVEEEKFMKKSIIIFVFVFLSCLLYGVLDKI